MRLLFVTGYFPPHSPIAGQRAPAMAKFFSDLGWDLKILTPDARRFPPLLQHDLQEEQVIRTPIGAGFPYLNQIPDPMSAWYRRARSYAHMVLRDWRPDLIYVTSPPMTGIRLAADLAERYQAPLVVEYRDLWTEHPYFPYFRGAWWRAPLERSLERRWTAAAAGYVTVTEAWAHRLAGRGRPVHLARNGFAELKNAPGAPDQPDLRLALVGSLYGEKRLPRDLFAALAARPDLTCQVVCHVDAPDVLRACAEQYGVSEKVRISGLGPHHEIIELLAASDVLVLQRWDGPAEAEVIPGKLFEYAGLGRPLLSIGKVHGEAEDLIHTHQLGAVAHSVEGIIAALDYWSAEKARSGRVAALPEEPRQALSRQRQWRGLPDFLQRLI